MSSDPYDFVNPKPTPPPWADLTAAMEDIPAEIATEAKSRDQKLIAAISDALQEVKKGLAALERRQATPPSISPAAIVAPIGIELRALEARLLEQADLIREIAASKPPAPAAPVLKWQAKVTARDLSGKIKTLSFTARS